MDDIICHDRYVLPALITSVTSCERSNTDFVVAVGGLNWWQSWLCVWVGYFISASFIVLTGRIGATYHIGFPVVGRASFGIWGTLWPVLNRSAMVRALPAPYVL